MQYEIFRTQHSPTALSNIYALYDFMRPNELKSLIN